MNNQDPAIVFAPYIPMNNTPLIVDHVNLVGMGTSTRYYKKKNLRINGMNFGAKGVFTADIVLAGARDSRVVSYCNYSNLAEQIQENNYISCRISNDLGYSFEDVRNEIDDLYGECNKQIHRNYDNFKKVLNSLEIYAKCKLKEHFAGSLPHFIQQANAYGEITHKDRVIYEPMDSTKFQLEFCGTPQFTMKADVTN